LIENRCSTYDSTLHHATTRYISQSFLISFGLLGEICPIMGEMPKRLWLGQLSCQRALLILLHL
jgi:hypothetical protein